MSFPEALLDEIKGRFRLSEYVGRSVQLKRSGRELVGLSPFVTEKTPSFFVNDDKEKFFDFAAGKTGDIFDWVVLKEGLSFVEAVKRLAEEAGVTLPERDGASAAADGRRKHLESILGLAADYFRNQLESREGREARAYLERRGLSAADWSRFGIGYAPSGNCALRDFMCIERRLAAGDVLAAGLLYTTEEQRDPRDRFRHRIVFPIYDAAGRIISFGGRALDPKAKAKYLNGPDTELFDKGRNLYGLHEARRLLAAGPGPLLVVEGYMDVVACLRAGIAACAPMGTSLTTAQLDLMWRFHPEPTLCFDGDTAGRRAAGRAMDMAIPRIGTNRSLRFAAVVGGKDPDEVLREQGPEALRSQMLKATPMAEAIFQREHARSPLDTPERRADLRERLNKIAHEVGGDLGREYRNLFRERIETLRTNPGRAPAQGSAVDAAAALRLSAPPVASALAYWLVKDPERALDDLERIERIGLGHPDLDRLVAAAVSWLMSGNVDGEQLAQHLHAMGMGKVVVALSDVGGRLADRGAWRRLYAARADYLALEQAVQAAKADVSPASMENFLALKAQRDAAKRAAQ